MTDHIHQGHANREWGKKAEDIAAEYLLKEGYVIRERNWRIGNSIEIDIIAEKERTIVFTEVKARKGNFILGEDAVDEKKMKKIIRGGNVYLSTLPFLYKYRLDMVIITGTPDNYTLHHYPDAFLPTVG